MGLEVHYFVEVKSKNENSEHLYLLYWKLEAIHSKAETCSSLPSLSRG